MRCSNYPYYVTAGSLTSKIVKGRSVSRIPRNSRLLKLFNGLWGQVSNSFPDLSAWFCRQDLYSVLSYTATNPRLILPLVLVNEYLVRVTQKCNYRNTGKRLVIRKMFSSYNPVSYLPTYNLFAKEHCCYRWEYRSQWPRGPRHEMSSFAQTLRSWVRIPLEAWMWSRFFRACVVLC
jgi:hypothetical protein